MKAMSFVKAGMAACLVAGMSFGAADANANLLTDPSFEAPITFDGGPFVGSWEGFNGGNASAANGTVMPRTGQLHLDLQITGANTFAGAFQDFPVVPGAEVTISAWHKSIGADSDGSEFRIEWHDAGGEIGRAQITPVPGAAYSQISVTDTAPAGALFARWTYAIQSFGGGPSQNVFVDDASLTIVPEPASMALMGLGALAMIRRR